MSIVGMLYLDINEFIKESSAHIVSQDMFIPSTAIDQRNGDVKKPFY